MKILLNLVLILFVCNQVSAQLTVDEIIENHLETAGISNLEKELTSFSIEGIFQQNKMDLPIKIQAKIPYKFRMDMEFNKLNFVKISNGNVNWEYNPMRDSVFTKEEKEPVVQDFIQRWTGGLYLYTNGKIKATLLGNSVVEDLDVYKIQFDFDDKTRVYYIDKLSYLILRIDDDLEEEKVTYYRDFRKVGKYFVPFDMVGYENGVPAISMKFSDVKLNPAISNNVFSKPNKAG
jgi:outer membrane lipoprotein-sorting protein